MYRIVVASLLFWASHADVEVDGGHSAHIVGVDEAILDHSGAENHSVNSFSPALLILRCIWTGSPIS
jgi:hypothetical protein